MKISFNWLKDLVNLPAGVSADEVARRLTLAGLEVESIDRRGRDVTGVRVVEVRGVRPHPEAEKLRIVKVSTGGAAEDDVVCGAPNVPGPGGRVAWARPGATLPGGLTLGRKVIRGFDSPGMLCSERELGLGDGVDGILILSPSTPLGVDLADHLGIADDVFEVNVTPNRADALSHAGIAREVAALFGVTWKLPPIDSLMNGTAPAPAANPAKAIDTAAAAAPPPGSVAVAVAVDIRDATACPRYQATVIHGVRVGPSPLALRMRLASCGVRAISNLVDVTNYIMLETGHPLHAFDLDSLQLGDSGIIVRRAAPGETMRTLDSVDRKLDPADIVIADARGPIALAGVMGGASSEVSATTTNLLLEAATFDPRAVRKTAKRLGMHSEASHRFERGVDAVGVPVAGARAATLLARLGGGRLVGAPHDRYPAPVEPRQVTLKAATLRNVAGFSIPSDVAANKLRSVEIAVVVAGDAPDGGTGDLTATVPTFRPDITIAEDLVEEVMRLVGYDQVPARLPAGGKAPDPSPDQAADRARTILAALGLHEIAGWAFVPRAALVALGDPTLAAAIAVKNPISADYEVMRTSLLPGLAEAARRNVAHGVADVRLFEVGPVVHPLPGDDHHVQSNMVGGVLIGRDAGWLKAGAPIDFFDAKHAVVELVKGLTGVDPRFAAIGTSVPPIGVPLSVLHPGVSAAVYAGGAPADARPLGFVGELHPAVARRLQIEVPAFIFELKLDALDTVQASLRAAAPPRFPPVTRDISFWIDAPVSAEAQREAMRAAGEGLLREISVLEDFRDPR
ncbi:MAG: phenylalanine--tRNA ligase subunit beta, partial [Deltaproteobacteria bacterium]|nr:phenylalanine--tRNA ligase subunit beta [Deltaproteobacteria bacterium]